MVHLLKTPLRVNILDPEERFHLLDTFLCEDCCTLLFIHGVVLLLYKLSHETGIESVLLSAFCRWLRDDEWSPCFIDQDRIHLIHDCVVDEVDSILIDE